MKILIFICVFAVEIDLPLFMERAVSNIFLTKLEGNLALIFDRFFSSILVWILVPKIDENL